MIPFLFLQRKKITFGQMTKYKKLKIDHRFLLLKMLKKKIKI